MGPEALGDPPGNPPLALQAPFLSGVPSVGCTPCPAPPSARPALLPSSARSLVHVIAFLSSQFDIISP